MFPANHGTTQLLLLLFIYAGCFLLSLPLCANRHVAAAESPISFSFDFTNSSSYDGRDIRLEGDANVHGNRVSLTCNSHVSRNCTGRISYVQPVPFYHNDTGEVASFATQFTFTIVLPPLGYPKGDGMAFFLTGYNSKMPPNTEGRGLGLMNLNTGTAYGEDRFVAVEFNTYTSNETSDHIGIDVNTVKNSVKTTSLASPGLGGTMTASINFTSSSRMLVARLHFDDDPSVQPVEVSAVLPDPVTSLLPPEVAVGFSAATGVKNEELHQILSWSFNSTLAPKKPKLIGTRQIAEIVVGACVFLILIWFLLSWFMGTRERNSIMAGAGLRQFLYRELAQATNNFSRESKLGEGNFGAVYKGKSLKVDHGQKQDVAIKEILKGSSEETQDFLTELNIITKTKHKNLVRLEGWCCCSRSTWSLMCWCCLKQVDHKLFLVYELMPKGDLDNHLHKNKDTVLPWPTRYHIVKGIASALVYLHHDCRPYILHRDIKPANILRDVQRITPATEQVQAHQEDCLTRPDQTVRPMLHDLASPIARSRCRRSKSRTPEGSMAMGITPSPPGTSQRGPRRSSPMKPASPLDVQPSFQDTVQYKLCSTGSGNSENFINSLPPPPSPPINWAELPVTAQPLGEAQVFDDCWSANIAPAPMADLGAFFPASPQHLRSPLHLSPEHQMPDQWAEFFGERSGDHVPNHQSIQQWREDWVDAPLPGPFLGFDQIQMEVQQTQLAMGDCLFGQGYEDQQFSQGHHTTEKTVYEISTPQMQMRPVSPGWQLQDIFATPPALPAPHSPDSSDEMDDATLLEVTLKSNALRALRDANLCGPGMVDEVTERVNQLHVDPKTSFMSKLLGMISPSLLGFPTNSKPKKKRSVPKNMLCMDTAIRRSERPATKSSTMLASRRAQASACKQLGLIERLEDFDDDIQAQYLGLFRQPLSPSNLQGLAMLAESTGRPAFVLPEKELQDLIRETPTAV